MTGDNRPRSDGGVLEQHSLKDTTALGLGLQAAIGASPLPAGYESRHPSDVAGGDYLRERIRAAQERGRKVRAVMIGGTRGI